MKTTKTIKYTASHQYLTIQVPVSLLGYLAKTHPDGPFKVKDQVLMTKEILEYILEEDSDTGLNKFEELIEGCIPDVADNGSEYVYRKEDAEY